MWHPARMAYLVPISSATVLSRLTMLGKKFALAIAMKGNYLLGSPCGLTGRSGIVTLWDIMQPFHAFVLHSIGELLGRAEAGSANPLLKDMKVNDEARAHLLSHFT